MKSLMIIPVLPLEVPVERDDVSVPARTADVDFDFAIELLLQLLLPNGILFQYFHGIAVTRSSVLHFGDFGVRASPQIRIDRFEVRKLPALFLRLLWLFARRLLVLRHHFHLLRRRYTSRRNFRLMLVWTFCS